MTDFDPHDAQTDPDDGALLSAYLDGDLSPDETATLEDRLAREPTLADALEHTQRLLVGLRALDEAEPPAGFSERLRERLATGGLGGEEDPAPELAQEPARDRVVVPLRRRWRLPAPVLGAAAAGLVALALFGSGILATPQGADDDLDIAFDSGPAEDEAETFDYGEFGSAAPTMDGSRIRGDGAAALAAPEAADAAEGAAPAPVTYEPVFLDDEAVLDDEAAARDRYTGLPEAEQLFGTPVEQAPGLARSAREAAAQAAPFPSGPDPDACLDEVAPGASPEASVLVLVLVETVRYAGEAALAHVLVGPSPGSEVLDRPEVWITAIDGCQTRLFLSF